MEITCPHCSFSKSVDPIQVPDRPVKATCPKCQQVFSFDKATLVSDKQPDELQVNCPACGLPQPAGDSCAGCGVVYAKWQARKERLAKRETDSPAEKSMPERRIICHGCGTVQAPASHCAHCGAMIVTTSSGAEEHEYAGFWVRFVAYLIDSFIIGGLQLVLGLLLGFAIGSLGGLTAPGDAAMGMVTWLFGVVIGLSYAVFFIGHCGQTLGKMALRIKVICTDGSEISYGRAALREVPGKFLSGILLGIGYLMVAFDSRKQGLHDKIANTYVIKL
jgi:uncharacterized RDD family membrane protein YckC